MNRGAEVEKDIKILENYIYGKKETMKEQLVVALENLIKGYRELEEENTTLKKANNIAENVKVDDLTQAMYKSYEDFMKKYIPKSKVKEKIEGYKKTLKHYGEYSKLNLLEKVNVDLIDARIQVLQELMEEKQNAKKEEI